MSCQVMFVRLRRSRLQNDSLKLVCGILDKFVACDHLYSPFEQKFWNPYGSVVHASILLVSTEAVKSMTKWLLPPLSREFLLSPVQSRQKKVLEPSRVSCPRLDSAGEHRGSRSLMKWLLPSLSSGIFVVQEFSRAAW